MASQSIATQPTVACHSRNSIGNPTQTLNGKGMIRWGLLLIVVASLTGCRGCQLPESGFDDGKKSDRSGKEQSARLELFPSLQSLPATSDGIGLLMMKPGHWYELHQSVRANASDEALLVSCSAVERSSSRPIPAVGLREPIAFRRQISLARGQRKRLAFEMLFPRMPAGLDQGQTAIRVAYLPRMLGAAVQEAMFPVTVMPDYQYYFVALSQNPSRFQFLDHLSSMIWPSETKLGNEVISPFRVIQVAQGDAQNHLPTRLTTWTATSHLLWNDCDANALVEKQQTALIDWLHFGGQIIINGPESQAALNASFLTEYLPLQHLRAGELDQARWQEFSRFWTIARPNEKEGQAIAIPHDRVPPLVDGELAQEARWVQGCEGMVAERFVGNGRVVMTTFSLGDSMMIRWPSFSSFFNGALMHRPPRVWYTTGEELNGDMRFAGSQAGSERDPAYTSRVRLMGRDLGRAIPQWNRSDSQRTSPSSDDLSVSSETDLNREPIAKSIQSQGVAQIESDAAFSRLATTALQKASGIQVPRVKTIVQLLTGYLLVLVPVNWFVFRAFGRVELAWLAAPCIAIIGAVVVARSVQLDVGFSRSQTTLNLLELKSGYQRGHLSSYVSLYSSLSTKYRAQYADNEGIVVPVNTVDQRIPMSKLDQNEFLYDYADEAGSGLSGFPVRSNSTSFLRGEEVIDLGGSISIAWDESDREHLRFQNATNLSLSGVGIIAKTIDGFRCKAWIGEMDSQSYGRIRIVNSDETPDSSSERRIENRAIFTEWGVEREPSELVSTAMAASSSPDNDLRMGQQLTEIAARHPLAPGEVMLLGWSRNPISQLEIEPKASQNREQSFVVVRANAADTSQLGPDLNLPTEQPNAQGQTPTTSDTL